jgi:aspartyl-tRNA(Asn)/glutamyl-tRNA(Gln) amidotransferase subunit A
MFELPARMTHLQANIRAGEVSVNDALVAQLKRGQSLNAKFPCVVEEFPLLPPHDGPLAGIALAHKDIFQLNDRMPGCGVGLGLKQSGIDSAAAISNLQQAGASQWAALVMAPYACGATSQNAHFARCINPTDANAAVGGSSSGSAVAVASGMSYAALGTDTAGSVRIPAATCGLLGLKTTHGAVSNAGCAPLAPSLDSVGILSRYAEDAREIWTALCPQLPRQAVKQTWNCELWLPEEVLAPLVVQTIRNWVSQFGANVIHINMEQEFDVLNRHAQRILFYETAQTHHAALKDGTAEPSVQSIGLMGLGLPKTWYKASLQSRSFLLHEFVHQHFSAAEFLIMPSLADTVPDWQTVEIGHASFDRKALFAMHRYMGFVNYLGLPSLNLPIGRDARGRAICVQVLAKPFAEHQLLNFAEQSPFIFWNL